MRKVVLLLACLFGALLVALLYRQLVVEGGIGSAALIAAAILFLATAAFGVTFALYHTRHAELLGKIWLAVGTTVVSYVVLDMVAGAILIKPLSPPLVPDLYVHHRMVPDSDAEFRQQDFAYVQHVNALGFRGADFPVEKPAGTYRVVMLGDSFTMGKGVKDDQTASVLLQRHLQQQSAACGGRTVQVINGGVDSYAPILELIQLKRNILPLRPDAVIVNLDVSDLIQESVYRQVAQYGPDGEATAVPQQAEVESLYERAMKWSEKHLFFTRAALFYANRRFGSVEVNVRSVLTEANREIVAHTLVGDVDRTRQWEDIFDSIRRMKDHANRAGAKFFLSIYPWPHQISDTEWVPGRYVFMTADAKPSTVTRETVHRLATRDSIELLDMFDTFIARKGEGPLYFPHDMHWNPVGQQVMADGLAAQLATRLDNLCGAVAR